MQLDVLTYAELPVIPFWRYDLIVLEKVRGQAMPALVASIKRVRTLSRAPLVVLMRSVAPEATIAGLNAGADAVTSLLASEQVLLAHWCAMLKRWKAV
jgi:DNA-binding response OmpR family regulator